MAARSCPTCGSENATAALFCSQCGTALGAGCPQCGTVPPKGARFCPSCGFLLVSDVQDEHKLATVLFVDLVGSTQLGERLDPDRLRSVLGSYFASLSTIVTNWGGTVEKYIGDAVVAVFGVPRVHEDDAARALSAAWEIQARMADISAQAQRRGAPPLAVRIGVNTGEVVAPNESQQERHVVIGDAMNVAARLEQAAEPTEIVVGERTALLGAATFRFGEPMELDLKGKSAPVRARRLIGPLDESDGSRRAGPLRSAMVGRDQEVATLNGVLADAIAESQPRLAVLVGPAGIGKSRLAREFLAAATAEHPDVLTLRGRCPAAGQGASLWAWAEILRQLCGMSLDAAPAENEARLRARVGEIWRAGGLSDDDAERAINTFAITAGLSIDGNHMEKLRAGEVSTETNRQWPRLLSLVASRRPVAVVIEDLHWSSDPTVDLLQAALQRGRGPLFLLATTRPEFLETNPALATGEGRTVIPIGPLTAAAGRQMLNGLLSGDALPDDLRSTLLGRAEGNPLFLEELLASLVDAGQLVSDAGAWRVSGSAADVKLPDSIQGVLSARIDALDAAEKRALQEAAVVGRAFWEPPVAINVGAPTIVDRLDRLERRGLVQLRPVSSLAGEDEYFIKHALVRDVAYGSLPRSRRARSHMSVAHWLGAITRDRPAELAELIAWHWWTALGDGPELATDDLPGGFAEFRAEARAALIVGGAAATFRYAPERAIPYHELALKLSDTDAERAEAYEQIGDDHDIAYHGAPALEAWAKALEHLGDGPETAATRARLAYKAAYMGAIRWGGFVTPVDPAEIDRFVDTGLDAVDPENRTLLGRLLAVRAAIASRWAAFGRTDPVPLSERIRDGERAQAIGHEIGDASIEVLSLRCLAGAYALSGQSERAIDASRRALAAAPGIAAPYFSHLYAMLGANAVAWMAGAFDEMLPVARGLMASGHELEPHDVLHSTCLVMACLYYTGRWDELLEVLQEHERLFALEHDMSCPYTRGGLMVGALTYAHRGDEERANALIELLWRKSEAPLGFSDGLMALAMVVVGDRDRGLELARSTLNAARRNSAEEPPVEILALLEGLSTPEVDVDALPDVIATARERHGELALLLPAADLAEGRLAASAGDTERAETLLARAASGFHGISVPDEAAARAALDGVRAAGRGGH
jgi:class 3 adenylate cyclase